MENVSIHAPYIGSDAVSTSASRPLKSFNPRSLHRERLFGTARFDSSWLFQSTLPT